MNDEVLQEIYAHILNDAQRIRKEIMGEWGDILMFGGAMPPDVMNELTIAARITGLTFDALGNHGIKYRQVTDKPDLYTLTVAGGGYICHKTAIPSMVGFLDQVNIPGVSQTAEPVHTPHPEYKNEEPPVRENKYVSTETYTEPPLTSQPANIPVPEMPSSAESTETNETSIDDTQNVPIDNTTENTQEPESPVVEETPVVPTPVSNNSAPQIISLSKSSLFIEETQKQRGTFVYEMFNISLTHAGTAGGGQPAEMQIMIAPLKIQKFACPSVPIIVAIYYNGQIYMSSSYSEQEEGKNIISMNVDEYYMLFRGTYDANGLFKGLITTTGPSAAQGDIINTNSAENYGADADNVNNGHIKFRESIYDAPGTIEVFPFGDPDDEEFVIMTKTDEFVDYIYVSNQNGGMKKPTIFDNGGKKEIICKWNDDILNVSLSDI